MPAETHRELDLLGTGIARMIRGDGAPIVSWLAVRVDHGVAAVAAPPPRASSSAVPFGEPFPLQASHPGPAV